MIRFGTSGWRAIISDEFTFRNVRLVTQAIANVLRKEAEEPSVVVGYDTRFLSGKVAAETATVLSENRIQVFLCTRDAPTPAVALGIADRQAAGGIYFTASHNPPEYNGLKYYTERGAPAPTEATDRIELEILRLENEGFDRQYLADERLVTSCDPMEGYLKHLALSVDVERVRQAGLKLAVDPLYGTTREYLDRVLIEGDCVVESIHNFTDPYFGGYSPECSEENLSELRRLVIESRADLGLATDGDGDRFGILAGDGSFFPADDVLPLLLAYLAREGRVRGGFARTVATSHLVDKVAAEHGIRVMETPVGFKYIAELLLANEAELGGEESAGFTLGRHLPEKDGILTCLLVAEMVATRRQTLGELRQELWAVHGAHHHRRKVIKLTPETGASLKQIIASPPDTLAGGQVESVSRVDGVKLILEDGSWCLLRQSGTEPVIRVNVESSSPTDLERIIHEVRGLLLGRR